MPQNPCLFWFQWSCRWWQLPDVGVWPQMGMLMCFQRLVELQESTRILMDLGQPAHNPNHQYAELKVRLSQLSLHHMPTTSGRQSWQQHPAGSDCLNVAAPTCQTRTLALYIRDACASL